jgi:hypothetical protein
MSRTSRFVVVLVGLAILIALLLGARRRGAEAPAALPPGATPVEIEAATAPSPSGPAAAAPAATAGAAPTAGAPGAAPVRVRIPRPPSLPALPDPSVATAPATTDVKGPTDRRGPGAPPVKMAELGEKLDTIADDIEECVAAWKELDPRIDATAMLAFQIGPAGLTDVWLAEHADLPTPTATCFSSAVYAIDWAGLTEEPIEITQRYTDGAEGAP